MYQLNDNGMVMMSNPNRPMSPGEVYNELKGEDETIIKNEENKIPITHLSKCCHAHVDNGFCRECGDRD